MPVPFENQILGRLSSLTPDTIGVLLGAQLSSTNASRSAIIFPGLLKVITVDAHSHVTFMPLKSVTSSMSCASNLAATYAFATLTLAGLFAATSRASTSTRM